VLALDQNALGDQAVRVATVGAADVYLKNLEDGGKALGFFNRDSTEQTLACGKLGQLDFTTRQHVRDLWRHQDLPDIVNPSDEPLRMTIPAHGVQLYKLTAVQK
jgi:alpha-galactosidase